MHTHTLVFHLHMFLLCASGGLGGGGIVEAIASIFGIVLNYFISRTLTKSCDFYKT